MNATIGASGRPPFVVAHFRRVLCKPTETFIHNILAGARETTPVGVTFRRQLREELPLAMPVLELYSWGRVRRLSRLLGRYAGLRWGRLHYDHPATYDFLTAQGASVLHAHFGYTGVELLPIRRRTGLPLITTFYGVDISARAADPGTLRRYQELFAEGERFLVEGPFMRERLVDLGCPADKIRIQRICIPFDRYRYRARLPERRPVRVLFCASLREKKGPLAAIEAVRAARDAGVDIEFIIIGDGPLRSGVEELIQRHRMQGYTRMLGMRPHSEMLRYLDWADLFIHPSVTASDGDSEGGAPTAILEAQASGVPVVTTEHADIPYVVLPGRSAVLSREADQQGLNENLTKLASEPGRWSDMGRAGRGFVRERHSVESEIIRLESEYFELGRRTESDARGERECIASGED